MGSEKSRAGKTGQINKTGKTLPIPRLSKSKVMLGRQCHKALYLALRQPEMGVEVSAAQQMIFDQGHEVGELARTWYPGGVLIEAPYWDSELGLRQTQEAIAQGALTIYEATLEHQDVLVKVDILTRRSVRSAWQLIEVKSSTKVKEEHIADVAIQAWVCEGAGLRLKSVGVMTLNSQCRHPDLSNLFQVTEVSGELGEVLAELPAALQFLRRSLNKSSPPIVPIGPHCDSPYICPFKGPCWGEAGVPDISVFNIPRLSQEAKWGYYESSLVSLQDLDPEAFNANQRRMIQCSLKGRSFVDGPALAVALSQWEYPLSFLDFETIAYAIPRYRGLSPYQQLPFQWSCHIQSKRGARLRHLEYLHQEDSDPRKAFCETLIQALPQEGSVVAYNLGFEKGVLTKLAESFPKYKKKLRQISERLVDPLPLIRAHVYHPRFAGSFSIKAVAPALLGKRASYAGLAVGDGQEAQAAYREMCSLAPKSRRRRELKKALSAYCAQDTLLMAELVDWLWRAAGSRK